MINWQRERREYEQKLRPFSHHRIRGLDSSFVNGVEATDPIRKGSNGRPLLTNCCNRPQRWMAQFGEYICTGCMHGKGKP